MASLAMEVLNTAALSRLRLGAHELQWWNCRTNYHCTGSTCIRRISRTCGIVADRLSTKLHYIL